MIRYKNSLKCVSDSISAANIILQSNENFSSMGFWMYIRGAQYTVEIPYYETLYIFLYEYSNDVIITFTANSVIIYTQYISFIKHQHFKFKEGNNEILQQQNTTFMLDFADSQHIDSFNLLIVI